MSAKIIEFPKKPRKLDIEEQMTILQRLQRGTRSFQIVVTKWKIPTSNYYSCIPKKLGRKISASSGWSTALL